MILTPAEAADIASVSEGTIRRWCKNGYLKHTKFGNQFAITLKDLGKVIDINTAYRSKVYLSKQLENKTDDEIAEECHVAKIVIERWIRRHGLAKKSMKKKRPYQDKEWLEEQIKIKTKPQIAKECGVNINTIYKYINEFGLQHKGIRKHGEQPCFGDRFKGFKNGRFKGFHRVAKL